MPELPEVETVRRGLAPALEGARIKSVRLNRADLRFVFPAGFARRLTGAEIGPLSRRGKYLLAPLSTGETLIAHLGMSGRFTVVTVDDAGKPGVFHHAQAVDPAHDHVELTVDGRLGAARVIYNDPRRFGFMDLAPTPSLNDCRHFRAMGPEPLSDAFTPEAFNAALAARQTPIKSALLDQRIVAGIGNIYACEALFQAQISPRRRASSVAGQRGLRLFGAIRRVLAEAIDAGGSSLRDFAGADGGLGYFQHRFSVYDRAGEACGVCGAPIRRLVQAGRSTFYCGACQR